MICTITNSKFRNLALLLDDNDRSDVVASAAEDAPGEQWEVKRLSNQRFTIRSCKLANFAGCTPRPKSGDSVRGQPRPKEWIIKEVSKRGHYIISPSDVDDLFWSLGDCEKCSPVSYAFSSPAVSRDAFAFSQIDFAEVSTNPQNQWFFTIASDTPTSDHRYLGLWSWNSDTELYTSTQPTPPAAISSDSNILNPGNYQPVHSLAQPPPAAISSDSNILNNLTRVEDDGPSEPIRNVVPLFRSYNAAILDHFYTTDEKEHENAIRQRGYQSQGTAALLLPSQTALSVPFFRLNHPAGSRGGHFYTTSVEERDNAVYNLGFIDEGNEGFVFTTQVPGSIPFYRLYHGTHLDHFYTTSAEERDTMVSTSGYYVVSTACFVVQA